MSMPMEGKQLNFSVIFTDSGDEQARIYGHKWSKFLANCKACLGTEAGVSIFDLEDKARNECNQIMKDNPNMSFEVLYKHILFKYENNIFYRTIGPRHFESAAFRVCQILFEGFYSGIMQPNIHYIPLKKDFSNFEEVISKFNDKIYRKKIAENAYRDLIVSGKYHYKNFIEAFDKELKKHVDIQPIAEKNFYQIESLINEWILIRKIFAHIKYYLFMPFPGRNILLFFVRPILKPLFDKYKKRNVTLQQI